MGMKREVPPPPPKKFYHIQRGQKGRAEDIGSGPGYPSDPFMDVGIQCKKLVPKGINEWGI